MILAILFAVLLGGAGDSWIARASKHVSDSIRDSAREEAAEAILEQMQDVVEAHKSRVLEIRREFDSVRRNYHATAADYRAVFRKIDKAWVAAENRLIKLRFELLRQFNPKEWVDLNTRVQADIDEARQDEEKKAS